MGESETKRGPGRPRSEDGEMPKRNTRVDVSTWTGVEAGAARLGITPSEYVRQALREKNAREVPRGR